MWARSLSLLDTFGGAKPRFLNRGKKRRSVLTLSIPRPRPCQDRDWETRPRPCHRPWQCWQSRQDRGVEWVDLVPDGVHFGEGEFRRFFPFFWIIVFFSSAAARRPDFGSISHLVALELAFWTLPRWALVYRP